MTTAGDIYNYIDGFAPFYTAMDFDNVGLLVGSADDAVRTVLLSLDATPAVVREAAAVGAQLVVTHHPVIFNPLKRLEPGTAPYLLAQYGIAAICAHTNLDMAPGAGVNACLAERLRLKSLLPLQVNEASGLPEAQMGETDKPYSAREFALFVKQTLGCDGLRYTDGGRPVTKVGFCSGGGEDYLYAAMKAGCQAFVTGESKHHVLLDAENAGITLVDAGHFYTENIVISSLLNRLVKRFPELVFVQSKAMHSPAKYL